MSLFANRICPNRCQSSRKTSYSRETGHPDTRTTIILPNKCHQKHLRKHIGWRGSLKRQGAARVVTDLDLTGWV
jgi:hypothetical protein